MADMKTLTIKGTTYNVVDQTARNTANAAVPATRTVNGKALSSNITLSASDVSAAPAYQYSTADLTAGTSSLTTGTLYLVYE